MEHAEWLARIFGPFMVIVGLWMLLYSANLAKVWSSIKNSPASFYTRGVINLLVGLTIVSHYNQWEWNLAVLVTLLGWAMIVKGVLCLYVPQLVVKATMTNQSFMKVMGFIPLVWGLALTWFAFLK